MQIINKGYIELPYGKRFAFNGDLKKINRLESHTDVEQKHKASACISK